MLTHRSVLAALLSWELDAQAAILMSGQPAPTPAQPPCTLLAVPLFHATGSHAVWLSCYRQQRRMVCMHKWDAVQAAELIERERSIAAQKAAESGKPAEIVAKMVEGSVQKFLKEVSLFNQTFVKNDKQTVEQMLKAANTQVAAFTMYIVGEGIEKKVDDFAAEVAAQVAAAKGA